MDIAQQLEHLLNSPRFHQFAAQACRQYGIPVPAGEDPRACLLLRVRENNPHALAAVISRMHEVDRFEAAREGTPQQIAAQQKLAKDLPPAKIAEAWKAIPASSRLRAKDPAFEKSMGATLARLGWAPLPGMTAAETVLGYFAAINDLPQARRETLFDELAEATGGAFGNADALRQSAVVVNDFRTSDARAAALDAETQKVVGKMEATAAAIRKGRGAEAPPSIEPEHDHEGRNATRAEVARQLKDRGAIEEAKKQAPVPKKPGSRTRVETRTRLYGHIAHRKVSGESLEGLEMGAALRGDAKLIANLRDDGFHVDEKAGTISEAAPPPPQRTENEP